MWALALQLGGSPAFAAEAAPSAEPVDTVAFDRALRRAQIAEGVIVWSAVGFVTPLLAVAVVQPDVSSRATGMLLGSSLIGMAAFYAAVPWAALAGRRAHLALEAGGVDAHPWMGTVALGAFAVCLSAATVSSALLGLRSSNPDAFDSGWGMGVTPSLGLAVASLYGAVGLSVAQVEVALRRAPAGPRTGSWAHRVMVRPALRWVDDRPTVCLTGVW